MGKRRPITAIDICAGAGGWACAARGLPVEIVFAVDMWEDACKTYELNFPGTQVLQADIRDEAVRAEIVREWKPDLVLGGIPCEWLSTLRRIKPGSRGAVTGEEIQRQRMTLDSALEIVRSLKPRWWCLEDVPSLRQELPPLTPYLRLNSAEYSGQRRKRLYVGEFPAPPRGSAAEVFADYVRPGPYRIGRRAAHIELGTSQVFRGNAGYRADLHRKSPTVRAFTSNRDAEVVIFDPSIPGRRRQIEWQEAARLQGFPEDFVFYGSPTSVGKMVGQAIQIDTGRAILEAIVEEAGVS